MELIDIPYKISYRNVKYPRLEFKTGELILILPPGFNDYNLLKKKEEWILNKTNFIRECLRNSNNKKISDIEEKEFRKTVLALAKKCSKKLSVKLNKIYFRKMKTKWASLSEKRNLTVNLLVKYLPEHLLGYVIFHEIVHVIEKRHNDRFWRIVSKEYSGFHELEMELFTYWFLLYKKLK